MTHDQNADLSASNEEATTVAMQYNVQSVLTITAQDLLPKVWSILAEKLREEVSSLPTKANHDQGVDRTAENFQDEVLALLEHMAATIGKRDTIASPHPPFVARYRNYRGEIGVRRIVPLMVYFGSTEWHPEPQWLLSALDLDKQAERDFALADFNPPSAGGGAVDAELEDVVSIPRAWAHKHAVELEQCSIFAADVGTSIAKAMTDCAGDLRAALSPEAPAPSRKENDAITREMHDAILRPYTPTLSGMDAEEIAAEIERVCDKMEPLTEWLEALNIQYRRLTAKGGGA